MGTSPASSARVASSGLDRSARALGQLWVPASRPKGWQGRETKAPRLTQLGLAKVDNDPVLQPVGELGHAVAKDLVTRLAVGARAGTDKLLEAADLGPEAAYLLVALAQLPPQRLPALQQLLALGLALVGLGAKHAQLRVRVEELAVEGAVFGLPKGGRLALVLAELVELAAKLALHDAYFRLQRVYALVPFSQQRLALPRLPILDAAVELSTVPVPVPALRLRRGMVASTGVGPVPRRFGECDTAGAAEYGSPRRHGGQAGVGADRSNGCVGGAGAAAAGMHGAGAQHMAPAAALLGTLHGRVGVWRQDLSVTVPVRDGSGSEGADSAWLPPSGPRAGNQGPPTRGEASVCGQDLFQARPRGTEWSPLEDVGRLMRPLEWLTMALFVGRKEVESRPEAPL